MEQVIQNYEAIAASVNDSIGVNSLATNAKMVGLAWMRLAKLLKICEEKNLAYLVVVPKYDFNKAHPIHFYYPSVRIGAIEVEVGFADFTIIGNGARVVIEDVAEAWDFLIFRLCKKDIL